MAAAARTALVASQRGFVRTGGFYGRYRRGGRSTSCCGTQGELKFLDTARAAAAVATGGTVDTNLVVIPQDDTESGRNGRKVVVKNLWFHGELVVPNTVTNTADTDTIRLLVVQDKQANGAAFTAAQVMAQVDYIGFRNLENQSRFKILWDTSMTINASTQVVNSTGDCSKQWSKYIKCNIPMYYDSTATSGAITTQRSNSVAVLAFTRAGLMTLAYRCRIRYTDD